MALCTKDRKGLHAELPSHHSKEGNEIAVGFNIVPKAGPPSPLLQSTFF